jgi:hypothetical protein
MQIKQNIGLIILVAVFGGYTVFSLIENYQTKTELQTQDRIEQAKIEAKNNTINEIKTEIYNAIQVYKQIKIDYQMQDGTIKSLILIEK